MHSARCILKLCSKVSIPVGVIVFTAAGFVLLANSAYAQATVLWITMTPLLYKFNAYCEVRYGSAVRHMPLETAAAAPPASIPAVVYMPPALRKGAAGWYPEFGKVSCSTL